MVSRYTCGFSQVRARQVVTVAARPFRAPAASWRSIPGRSARRAAWKP